MKAFEHWLEDHPKVGIPSTGDTFIETIT